ncbi:MAG: helix-turn-helix domain-containing protein [Lentisphaeria bacterium]|nr:helix-turn-helix domain-containing protein [Lentisphaeria bacterium]
MIKVLQKTFDVLEFVAMQPHPVLPNELVGELGLSQPTAVRILRDLSELGYLEQAGSRKGYRLGPVPFHLAGGKLYDDGFMRFASAVVRDCARELGQSVQFAVRRRSSRFILCHYNFNPRFYVDTTPTRFRDLYVTGSGRTLLAFAPEPELDAVVAETGLPSPGAWPEASADIDALKRELGRIRTARAAELPRSACGNFHVYARPVFRDRAFLGVVASNWEADAPEDASQRCREAITQLAARLSESRKLVVG